MSGTSPPPPSFQEALKEPAIGPEKERKAKLKGEFDAKLRYIQDEIKTRQLREDVDKIDKTNDINDFIQNVITSLIEDNALYQEIINENLGGMKDAWEKLEELRIEMKGFAMQSKRCADKRRPQQG